MVRADRLGLLSSRPTVTPALELANRGILMIALRRRVMDEMRGYSGSRCGEGANDVMLVGPKSVFSDRSVVVRVC